MIRRSILLVPLLALGAALLLLPAAALANGVPVKVTLGYVQGLSNWGPTGAGGVADVRVAAGYMSITAAGLPKLDNQLYEGWLVNTRTGAKWAMGRFNANDDGTVTFERHYDSVPDGHYDLVLLCLVAPDQQTTEPTAQVSLAGYYPVMKPVDPNARPAELPFTGGDNAGVGTPVGPLGGANPLPIAVALVVGLVLGFGARSVLPRRKGGSA